MKTAIAVTPETSDLGLAVEELVSQVRSQTKPERNSVGIVFCDAEMDVAGLGAKLHAELGMDVLGVTSVAYLERNSGYNDMGVLLSVLTADDVFFSVGGTEDFDKESFSDAIRKAYREARAKIEEDPKLIMVFAPFMEGVTSDCYLEVLDEASGGVPIFGGVATDYYDFKYQKTFYNDRACSNGLVFLLVSGNVKPVFSMEHHFGAKMGKKSVITKSTGNLVEKVNDHTFKDFLASMVPVPDETVVISHFESTPFSVELPDHEKGEEPVVRVLCTIDHKTGAGGFISKMYEGSTLWMNISERKNLNESCKGAMSGLIKKMAENEGYEYSMVFIATCAGRHLVMGDVKTLESDIVTEKLSASSPDLNAAGFYAFGEMCPTGTRAGGAAKNRFHNFSFAVCAI